MLLPPPQPLALPHELGQLQRLRHRTDRQPHAALRRRAVGRAPRRQSRATPTFSASPARSRTTPSAPSRPSTTRSADPRPSSPSAPARPQPMSSSTAARSTARSTSTSRSMSSCPAARRVPTPSSRASPRPPRFWPSERQESIEPVVMPVEPMRRCACVPTEPAARRCSNESDHRPRPPAHLSRPALRRSRRMVLPVGRTQSRRPDAGPHRPALHAAVLTTSSSCSANPRRRAAASAAC